MRRLGKHQIPVMEVSAFRTRHGGKGAMTEDKCLQSRTSALPLRLLRTAPQECGDAHQKRLFRFHSFGEIQMPAALCANDLEFLNEAEDSKRQCHLKAAKLPVTVSCDPP